MDVYLAIASKRDERRYAARVLPEDVVNRILDAGRLSGSSQNKQLWRFVVADATLAHAVWAPENVGTAALVVAIVGEAGMFDVGRCAQNMMLAAWNEGVASCPNGIRDPERAAQIAGGEVKMILSFGYPLHERHVDRRTAEEWSARANRKALDDLLVR